MKNQTPSSEYEIGRHVLRKWYITTWY